MSRRLVAAAALVCAAAAAAPASAAPPTVEMTWISIANGYFRIGDKRIEAIRTAAADTIR